MIRTALCLALCLSLTSWNRVDGFSSRVISSPRWNDIAAGRGTKVATVVPTTSIDGTSSTTLNAMDRKRALKQLIGASSIMVLTSASISRPAFADVTNKVASQAALRYIKRTIPAFEKLEFYAAQNDYKEMKLGLRTPALSEIRKNGNTLIKGGEDGPEAQNLVEAYAQFIKNLEALDSSSSLGVRGKKGVQLYSLYKASLNDLNAFVVIAERSVQVPLQVVSETSVVE